MKLRTVLFWSHLSAGVVAGVVILVMSFTGAVLALKPQILNRIESRVRFVTPRDAPRLGPDALLAAVKAARPGSSPSALTIDRAPDAAVSVNLGTAGNVYVDPYSGAILGSGSERANRFFQSITTWHRYMGATGESRTLGRSATGAGNFAFLVLALSGLYIWWPKEVSWRHLRPITWFRRTSTGRARDFNWHNVIGFWCLPAIVVMTLSGVVMSYPWANSLVYRLTGSPVPTAAGRAVPEAAREAGAARPEASQGRRPGNDGIPAIAGSPRIDEAWARAEQQVPTWSLVSVRLPNRDGGAVSFTITDGAYWNAFARSTLTVNSASGEVVTWQPYDAGTRGQKVRGWLRFAHTGELGGLPGQIIAGVGCLGGVMLVCTGLSLAFRRLWHWSFWSRWLRVGALGRSPRTLPVDEAATGQAPGDQAIAAMSASRTPPPGYVNMPKETA